MQILAGLSLFAGLAIFLTSVSVIHQILGAMAILSASVLFVGSVINTTVTTFIQKWEEKHQ